METYQEFLDRIGSFEKKEADFGGAFRANPSIAQKADGDGRFRGFYGDTVVFTLDGPVKGRLARYAQALYQAAPECFCERLRPDTFHMTLHDLSSAGSLRDVAEAVFENELRVVEALGELRRRGAAGTIRMKSKCVFNMVDTSLVLGLYPAGEGDYLRLMELYAVFDRVRPLGYPFTPHITLAYYNVNGFGREAAGRLEAAVRRLNDRELEIGLDIGRLCYQKFRSMNDYVDIVSLGMTEGPRLPLDKPAGLR